MKRKSHHNSNAKFLKLFSYSFWFNEIFKQINKVFNEFYRFPDYHKLRIMAERLSMHRKRIG